MQSAFSLQLSSAQPSGELRFTDKDFCMHCHVETERERPEREQKPEPELGKKVRARYAWEVRPEFLFCVWHAVRILLGQGPCYHLAELIVSSPLLFTDVVVRTSVKWQCHCGVLAKPGLQYETSFW